MTKIRDLKTKMAIWLFQKIIFAFAYKHFAILPNCHGCTAFFGEEPYVRACRWQDGRLSLIPGAVGLSIAAIWRMAEADYVSGEVGK